MESAILDSDVFVLNGDTFDFRWSTYRDMAETVDASFAWLDALTSRHPEVQFQFLLGNHDTVRPFVEGLDGFTARVSNLEWHEHHLQMGDHLFLHGDVADGMMTLNDLREHRAKWMKDEQRGEGLNRLWDAAFGLGLHKVVPKYVFPTDKVIERIQFHLEDIGHGPGSGIEHVIFGHTHVRVDGLERNGQTFTNCGAPMPGLKFEVLRREIRNAESS